MAMPVKAFQCYVFYELTYHRVREMIACNAIQFIHVESKDNYANILTKPLPKADHERLVTGLTRRRDPDDAPLIVQQELEKIERTNGGCQSVLEQNFANIPGSFSLTITTNCG